MRGVETFIIKDIASSKSWSSGTAYTSWSSSIFTFSASGGGNNGKYYSSDYTWRFYTGGSARITPSSGYEIVSVTSEPKKTWSISNTGVASYSATSNTSFTSITVTYKSTSGSACSSIDVTGGSAVILPSGSWTDDYAAKDWRYAGSPIEYGSEATMAIGANNYCMTFTNVYDANGAAGLQVKASGGSVSIAGITSNYGIDVDIQATGTNNFTVSLTGAAANVTGNNTTLSISTTYTTATLTITKSTSSAGYLKKIRITPKAAPVACSAEPTVGAASLNGSFTLSSVGVQCASADAGDGCSLSEYGFVWGTSNTSGHPNKDDNVVTNAGAYAANYTNNLTSTFVAGNTYYYRGYAKNNGDNYGYSSVVQSFTPYTVNYNKNNGSAGGSAPSQQVVNTGGTVTLAPATGNFTLTGYHIAKWAAGSAGGTQYTPNTTSPTISGNTTFYAIWEANTYAITLNGNGATGAGSPASVNATYNAHALSSAITNPTKTDYIFGGWNTKADGSGLTVIGTNGELIADVSGYTDASGNWTKAGTETLYAKWTEHSYTNYRTSCCTDPGLAYGTASVTKTYGASAFTNTLTNSNSVSVSYGSSDTDVATVASDGTVTIKGAGSTTITASSAAQTVSTVAYCADEASYTLTVAKADISPSLSYSSSNVTVDETSGTPTVSGNSGSGAVTYAITSISPAGCATINTSTGVVTGVAVGSITVTATIAATDNYNGSTATADLSIISASYFPKGKTIFIQAHSTSAWTGDGCVMAWFHTSGGSETAQPTYWLFDATGDDSGKKLFATVAPATGDLPYLDIQRFAANCSTWWNKNGGCSYADASGSNAIRSTGKHDTDSDGDYVRWNDTGVTLDLHGDPSGDDWASSLASFSDQGAGVWTATYSNYAPANAAGESQDFKVKTNYNGWIGNTGTNSNATLSGMHVGSTYNVTATLNVTTHSLTMSKTFVKGEVSFDLQGHGSAISKLTNVTAGSKISAPSEPSATGYTFGGWFTDPECTDEWNFASDEVEETMTLYAKWTIQTYSITATLTGTSVNTAFPSSFTYTGSTTTALNRTFSVNTTNYFMPGSVSVTMGGSPLTVGTDYTYNSSTGAFTIDIIITGDIVITATATAKLQSIAITTQPTTRKYFAGESFSSAGAVVTATMGDGSTKAVTASATWTPPATPLAAGTGLTVTASYTENAINQTATTTIDVYSVTVNKVNEDGDAIDVAGVTATWTLGTKTLAAGVGSTKYVFKEWQVTGATTASTTSASTTLSNPTANVVVNAVFWKPRVVKWSVNGNDSYNTGSPTTTVAYNGTISTVPTNPSGLACASTFIAWTDATHNNGQTAKASDSYYGSALYTDAGDFPNITAETTTFYAVFAEGTGAAVNTVMWSEDWTGATYSDGSTGMDAAKPSAQGSHTGKTVYGSATVTYSETDAEVYVRNDNTAKGAGAPELLIKSSKAWTISGIPTGGAVTLTLSFTTNKSSLGTLTVATAEGGKTPTMTGSITGSSAPYYGSYTITTDGASTINITFGNTSNTRLDDIDVKVATVSLTNYVTECDANIVSVTYDANGGSTSCTNTTTDKTEDYTVCSTPPTRDYYTFAGWLCSADSKTYAASATIPAAAIDADFTLTAQWTPVTYTITYNYNGGSAQVDPAPATSYTVESSDITLQTPTKGHDRFEGWYENADLSTGGVKTTIAAGSHENKTYYAKWTARHEIVFDADGTETTIYRASDENMGDAVAGQGSKPSNPSAPSACSSKVFVGWSESEIDDETDTRPGDLTNATGTVNADKHYYAVWATQASTSGPVTVFEDALYGKAANNTTFDTYGDWDSFGYVYGCGTSTAGVRVSSQDNGGYLQLKANIGLASVDTIKFKIKSYGDTNGGKITLSSYSGAGTYDNSTSAEFTTTNTSSWEEKTCILRSADNTTDIRFEGEGSKYRIYLKDIKITKAGTVYTYSAYSTSCCATKVTLSENSPEHGTIVFGKTSVGTCGDQNVSLTITPAAGYQLHSYEVATGSGKVAAKSVSPAISLDNNSSAVQNITLTFADEANGAYDVTASFSLMTVTSWSWTLNSATIPDPLNLYVGQNARLDVAYTPAGVDASKKTYTRNKDNAYINWVGSAYAGYSTISGKASTGENTTEVTFTHADGPTKTVNVKVLPLPLTHFEDLVHGKAFADVAATIEANALSATKTTPTSDDWTTPNANTCEENHLHLVGWIRSDWPALVAYLNGTGDAPTTTAIVGAGNDGSGSAYFFAPNASINVLTFNGATFYAVWAEIK